MTTGAPSTTATQGSVERLPASVHAERQGSRSTTSPESAPPASNGSSDTASTPSTERPSAGKFTTKHGVLPLTYNPNVDVKLDADKASTILDGLAVLLSLMG